MINLLIKLAEKQLIPDFAIRYGIRALLKKRIDSLVSTNPEENTQSKIDFIHKMNASKIALVPELANKQHYDIPASFYKHCLGRHRKYSSCYWDENSKNLDEKNSEIKEAVELLGFLEKKNMSLCFKIPKILN